VLSRFRGLRAGVAKRGRGRVGRPSGPGRGQIRRRPAIGTTSVPEPWFHWLLAAPNPDAWSL